MPKRFTAEQLAEQDGRRWENLHPDAKAEYRRQAEDLHYVETHRSQRDGTAKARP